MAYWITKAPPPTTVGLRVRHVRTEFEQPDAKSWFLTQAVDACSESVMTFCTGCTDLSGGESAKNFAAGGRRRAQSLTHCMLRIFYL